MDISMERSGEGANIGSLFQQIINDMKNTSPLWEDFVTKATKLHSCLRATIAAIASYLEAFQKIADAATSSKGASKEIGSALTRVCLRHKAVETRLKTFTTAIMDCLILPLQENIEDWKKQVAFIDKEHAKEHKRCRSELKKRSTDTLRLQKKARKGQHQGSHLQDNLQSLVDSSMQDVNARRAELDEVERKSLRTVMIEERMRYCTFVYMLQPVVKEECEVMYELGHLQEVMQNIGHVTKDPHTLPQASEDLILESKTSLYPDSPGGSNSQACSNSLGSRKSSVCSISSINSNSSGSPGHQFQRSLSQYSPVIRLRPGESKDSGFCSSPALALQAATSSNQSHPVTTWPPQSQDPANDSRPHTISTAYEKGHQRPPLTVYTFQSPDSSNTCTAKAHEKSQNRPPLPVRCSSLERPLSSSGLRNSSNSSRQCPSPIPSHIAKEYSGSSSASSAPQPTYVNMAELVSMAANRITNHLSQASFRELDNLYTTAKPQSNSQQPNSPVLSSTSASSLVSPDSSATNPISAISSPDAVSLAGTIHETPQITPQNTSPQTPQAVVARDHDLNRDGDITPGYGSQCIIPTNERVVEKALSKSQFDSKTVGSVLEKANLFETLEKQQKEKPVQLREEVIYRRRDESYKSTSASASERDSESNIDPIDKDTIEELNNLIGELDLFQKEHEEMEKKLNEKLGYCNNARSDCLNENHSDASSDRNEKLSYLSSDTLPVSHLTKDNGTTATTKWSWKFQNNEYIDNEMLSYVPDDSMGDFSGYENPSFVHLNDKEIVVIRENAFPNEIDAYNHNHSEVITLNCTAQTSSMQQLDEIGRSDSPLQRFSSFRSDTPPMPLSSQNNSLSSVLNDSGSNESSPVYHQSPARLRHSSSLLEDKPRLLQSSKPAANPRPASLSGANVTRIARRASVNTVKPPPPVRRSSSVTPAHNLDNQSPAVSTQNLMTSSSENLPPPPAYLLDTGNQLVPGNVAGTVKALNEIKHTPASPGVLRRVQHQAESQVILKPSNASYPSYHSSPPPVEPRNSSGIYAKPQLQQVQNTSSFKQQTSQTSQKPQGILSQIASRINSSKHQQQSTQQVSNNFQSYYGSRNQPEPVYVTQESARFGHENQNSLQLKPTEGKKKSHIPSITPTSSSTYNHPHYQQGAKYQRPDQSQFISGRNYVSTNPFLTSPPSSSNSYGGPNSHPNYLPSSFGKSPPAHQSNYLSEVRSTTNAGSVISKTSAGFLENLNQKLAEQRLSGKAYAVRSYINSHTLPASENNYTCVPIEYESIVMTSNNIPAINPPQYSNYPRNLCEASVNQNFSQKHHRNAIKNNIHGQGSQNSPRNVQMQVSQPDPRVCHESLMDQIKKGATLKRNRTCNDRSAPKIH